MKNGKSQSKKNALSYERQRCDKIRKEKFTKLTVAEQETEKVFKKMKLDYIPQYPIFTRNSFILVDFFLPHERVAIEIDGASHENRKKTWHSYNNWREKVIHRYGATLWRFKNKEVLKSPDNFRKIIAKKLRGL